MLKYIYYYKGDILRFSTSSDLNVTVFWKSKLVIILNLNKILKKITKCQKWKAYAIYTVHLVYTGIL